MLDIVLFNKSDCPILGKFDKLLFREKWFNNKILELDKPFKNIFECRITDKTFFESLPKNKIARVKHKNPSEYKTVDSLGRPIPKRDENGKFIKKETL